jgi:hypothetical protein
MLAQTANRWIGVGQVNCQDWVLNFDGTIPTWTMLLQ